MERKLGKAGVDPARVEAFQRFRNLAVQKCHEWLLARIEHSDGLGTIFPAMVNSIFALSALGYPPKHPLVQREKKELERFLIREGDSLRLQPCFSPVWDTAWSVIAAKQSGVESEHPALISAVEWLLSKETTIIGDWAIKNPQAEPSERMVSRRGRHGDGVARVESGGGAQTRGTGAGG
jgi:squalene-hopene/tetraprenyl-beta-curcumene cyclase